jgi:hypothetical protein
MLSGSCSVGTVARSENKSNGMRKAQSSPGATGRIATRITAARKDQTINLRKEYILRIDHTPASVQNLNDVADDFGYQRGLTLPGLVADKFARNLCFSLRRTQPTTIAIGWSEPVCVRNLHTPKSSGFHGALFHQLTLRAPLASRVINQPPSIDKQSAVLPDMRQEFTLPHSYESSEVRAVDPNPKCHLRPMVDPVCNL